MEVEEFIEPCGKVPHQRAENQSKQHLLMMTYEGIFLNAICATFKTPHDRLHHRRSVFDDVVEMSVHDTTISSILQIKKWPEI
jgi:hypothetical protein